MSLDRRELLQALGVAGASAWLAACGGQSRAIRRQPQIRDEVRTWLREAVARLAAVYPHVHALAVTRRRTTVGLDIVGSGIHHARRDGVVLAVRDRDGHVREVATSDLTGDGVATAVRALARQTRPARVTFPAPPPAPSAPVVPGDAGLERRVQAIAESDRLLNSRIVYAAALIDIDDATVWSIAPDHDREQRLVRVRKRAIRAAWAGSRPVLAEAERGWIGDVDQYELGERVEDATAAALLLTTPGTFDEKQHEVVLDPSVAATLIDTGTRALLTTTAARRPEVKARLAMGASLAAPAITIVDDPTVPGAYGGFAFDDAGQPAAPVTLVDEGRVGALLATTHRVRRPGHLGPSEAAPSHLRLAAGTTTWQALAGTGFILEGGQHALFDPSTDRVVVAAARAREVKSGMLTGRVFADVELVGTLATLLAAVTGVAQETAALSIREELDGEPRWRSVEAPYVATRGLVRMRRRA